MTDSEKTTFMKYIEKKKLETPCRICPFNLMICRETGCIFENMREIVEQEEVDAPAIDTVPVVHGFLKNVPYKKFDPPDAPYGNEVDEETGWTFEWDTKTVCSVCGYEPYSFKPKYCENCGAKMDEKEDEQDEMGRN